MIERYAVVKPSERAVAALSLVLPADLPFSGAA